MTKQEVDDLITESCLCADSLCEPCTRAIAALKRLTVEPRETPNREIERLRRALTAIHMDYISADAMSQCAKRALEGAEQTIPGHGRVPVGLEKLIR